MVKFASYALALAAGYFLGMAVRQFVGFATSWQEQAVCMGFFSLFFIAAWLFNRISKKINKEGENA